MYAIRSYYVPIGLVAGPADNGDADVMDDSYDPLRGHGGKLAGVATSTTMTCYVCHRITSYNVCYTKLLRRRLHRLA